ncbi:DUF6191 domain-containing protein [Antrihabitans cavernicola]|uniref:Uncharacterized protein n=1 Tax=Antrihabitans cavernicola TaxID=2495913 RepID=A0A5A7SA56_9NOCA|nr:DUF6191 domain-containing protein [Spelaeibacter cavernicola]KAA0021415.1 hypothetical protein FOY51_19440 [Spelaeibacter cavernicola]
MATALGLSLPLGVLVLLAVGGFELRRKRRSQLRSTLSATYVDELTALFYGSKRMELDHRDSTSMLRDDDSDGAPRQMDIDLDRGTAALSASSLPDDQRRAS